MPVIEAYPGTAFIFVGSLLTLVFGVLNLIVAATCHGKTYGNALRGSVSSGSNQSISQSINQSINESMNQPTNQSINQPTNQPVNDSMNQQITQSTNQQICGQKLGPESAHAQRGLGRVIDGIGQGVVGCGFTGYRIESYLFGVWKLPAGHPRITNSIFGRRLAIGQDESISQSVNQSINQPINQSINQSISMKQRGNESMNH